MVKNILVISKLALFDLEPSDNRLKFLNFISKKPNVKLLNDSNKITLKRWIISTQKRMKWIPDVIIYYFLSRNEKWTTIDISDFSRGFSNIPRYMMFEDRQYIDVSIPLYRKYGFKKLINIVKHDKTEQICRNNNVDVCSIDLFIDHNVFKERNNEKKYDFLLYGFINDFYPLRKKMRECLEFIMNKTKNAKIKIVNHPGYYKSNVKDKIPMNEELSNLINRSRFTLVSSSFFNVLLKKYYEAPMSGSTIIGDIPPEYKKKLEGKIIPLNFESTHKDIMKVLQDAVNNKYLDIEKKCKLWGEELRKTNNFEAGYKNIYKIIDN
jgi:hypothetical protein